MASADEPAAPRAPPRAQKILLDPKKATLLRAARTDPNDETQRERLDQVRKDYAAGGNKLKRVSTHAATRPGDDFEVWKLADGVVVWKWVGIEADKQGRFKCMTADSMPADVRKQFDKHMPSYQGLPFPTCMSEAVRATPAKAAAPASGEAVIEAAVSAANACLDPVADGTSDNRAVLVTRAYEDLHRSCKGVPVPFPRAMALAALSVRNDPNVTMAPFVTARLAGDELLPTKEWVRRIKSDDDAGAICSAAAAAAICAVDAVAEACAETMRAAMQMQLACDAERASHRATLNDLRVTCERQDEKIRELEAELEQTIVRPLTAKRAAPSAPPPAKRPAVDSEDDM
jgi:hypothetical protein